MKTVIETQTFKKQVEKIWSEEERLDFISYISQNPEAGILIPGAEGARKVRWSTEGKGKQGGSRVIYFNVNDDFLCLVAIYKKAKKENMSPHQIKQVK